MLNEPTANLEQNTCMFTHFKPTWYTYQKCTSRHVTESFVTPPTKTKRPRKLGVLKRAVQVTAKPPKTVRTIVGIKSGTKITE